MWHGKAEYFYIRSWFGLDCMIVCTDWFEIIFNSGISLEYARMTRSSRSIRMLRMVRLLRLVRMKEALLESTDLSDQLGKLI